MKKTKFLGFPALLRGKNPARTYRACRSVHKSVHPTLTSSEVPSELFCHDIGRQRKTSSAVRHRKNPTGILSDPFSTWIPELPMLIRLFPDSKSRPNFPPTCTVRCRTGFTVSTEKVPSGLPDLSGCNRTVNGILRDREKVPSEMKGFYTRPRVCPFFPYLCINKNEKIRTRTKERDLE